MTSTERAITASVLRVGILSERGWKCRVEGADGLGCWDHPSGLRLIHSIATENDGYAWAHVSVSRHNHKLASWNTTAGVWRMLYPTVVGLIVVPPEDEHVNIAEVMHVWGCLDARVTPDFTHGGTSI